MRYLRGYYQVVVLTCLLLWAGSGGMALAQSGQVTHQVSAGETLYQISKHYGVTVDQLIELNPQAKEGIRIGEVLKLPHTVAIPRSSRHSEPTYHVVRQGETLYSIAKSYGTTVDAIMKANEHLSTPEQLSINMMLRIPVASERSNGAEATQAIKLPPAGRQESSEPPLTPKEGMVSLRTYTVPVGATIYSLLRETGWSEEEFFHYNPQARAGLKAGSSILIPDLQFQQSLMLSGLTDATTVVLALPFETTQGGHRFAQYYEGFLLALLEEKQAGNTIDLHVLDCGDQHLGATEAYLSKLARIDLVIGGVSEASVLALAKQAGAKGATYVVPFTSRQHPTLLRTQSPIYQVNTPHDALFREAASKFVNNFRRHHVLLLDYPSEGNQKGGFITTLKEEMKQRGINYTEMSSTQWTTPQQVRTLSLRYPNVVVVPTSGSKVAANNTITPIAIAADSLNVTNVTAFGYPEWQTYLAELGEDMRKIRASFYSTFYLDINTSAFKDFQRDYIKWYGHGIGSTFPKYSILGYDTGKYFLPQLRDNAVLRERLSGIQSNFYFSPHPQNAQYKSNLGVFFVKFGVGSNSFRE